MTGPSLAPHVGEAITDSEVSRMGVTLARLATLGAKEVLRFRVWFPGEHGVEVISPWNAQWGLNAKLDHAKRMAAKYHVREHGPLDLREWDATVPLHGPPSFLRDQFEQAWASFTMHACTLQVRAEPVAYAMRASSKTGPWLEVVKMNAGVSTGVVVLYDTNADEASEHRDRPDGTPRGELLALAPCRLLRAA